MWCGVCLVLSGVCLVLSGVCLVLSRAVWSVCVCVCLVLSGVSGPVRCCLVCVWCCLLPSGGPSISWALLDRSLIHLYEPTRLRSISYAVFCLS